MFQSLVEVQDLLLKFGGHPMAAGFSLEEKDVDEFRRRLNENARERLTEEDFIPKVWIDVAMPFEYITEPFIEELELLEPYGQEVRSPSCPEGTVYTQRQSYGAQQERGAHKPCK